MTQTTNLNDPSNDFLSGLHFELSLMRCPGINFMCTRANIPGVSVNNPDLPTPFKTIPLPADKLEYEEFDVTFKVDALMSNWLELYNWLIAIGFPASYAQRAAAEPTNHIRELYSDASLLIKDFHHNDILSIQFHDLLPIHLGSMPLDATQTDIDYVEVQCSFKYRDFSVVQLKTTY